MGAALLTGIWTCLNFIIPQVGRGCKRNVFFATYQNVRKIFGQRRLWDSKNYSTWGVENEAPKIFTKHLFIFN
jgi:hypothetical protein